MKLLGRLFALFLLVPIIELALLIQVGQWIGTVPTIAIIVLTGAAGSYLAKREGLSVWRKLRAKLEAGGLPGEELLDGVIILIAGALLITPGVLSDLSGIIGFFPPTRAVIRRFALRRIKKALREGTLQTSFTGFGASPWHTPDAPPSSNGSEPTPESAQWSGAGRAVPHHQDDPDESEKPSRTG